MTDTSGVATSTAAEKTREAVAQRLWINAAGEEVSDPFDAIGFKYVDLPTKREFIWDSTKASPESVVALAIFGGLTKAGNIRSTLAGPNAKDPSSDPVAGIEDWFEALDGGVWSADRVGGGIRVNPDILAAAIAHVKGETHPDAHQPYLVKITSKTKVKDPGDKAGKKEILYSTFAMRNQQVAAEYNRRLPQHSAAPSTGDL